MFTKIERIQNEFGHYVTDLDEFDIRCQICRIRVFLCLGFSKDYIETTLKMCDRYELN